jgi:O-antigen/teichoic acid export membrane protein
MKRILTYSLPILILGLAGILNQTIDKIIFPFLYNNPKEANVQLGIYGAATKIAMIMAMFIQSFRYAYEPFVFGKNKEKGDSRPMYASAMKYFIIFALLAFLTVVFYIDILRYIIRNSDYWPGLKVVPVVMAAELFMGIYFNLSFWYKLTDKTLWGALFSLTGCLLIVSLNIIFVPKYGYMACAYAGLVGYAVITILSYIIGQKKYPIKYDLKGISAYVIVAAGLYLTATFVDWENTVIRLSFRTVLLLIFVAFIVKKNYKSLIS